MYSPYRILFGGLFYIEYPLKSLLSLKDIFSIEVDLQQVVYLKKSKKAFVYISLPVCWFSVCLYIDYFWETFFSSEDPWELFYTEDPQEGYETFRWYFLIETRS